jgi:polyhydroxybutyrate depolymerase
VSGCDKGEVVGVTRSLAGAGARRGWLGGALAAVLLVPLLAACTTSSPPSTPAGGSPSPSDGAHQDGTAETISVNVDKRPFSLHIPASYHKGSAVPLVILLHGYTASGEQQEGYMKFTPESDKRGFLYAFPDGTIDPMNNRFWNATDACCDLYGSKVDDSTYITDIIKSLEKDYTVDTAKVYLVGHSNGAFMDYRMACDHADLITAIAPLNGAMWLDTSKCKPANPVSVLDIRSTSDETINYQGGAIIGHKYPSAAVTEADWLAFDHCGKAATAGKPLDLDTNLPGAETSVAIHASGCAGGSTVEVWTINGGTHIPAFNDNYAGDVMDVLLNWTKPTV